jgi:hypothetical protein
MIHVNKIWYIVCFILIFFSLFPMNNSFAENEVHTARITDTDGNEYLFDNFSRNGYTHFNCLLQDTVFKLAFSQILTITFTDTSDKQVKGYTQATVVLTTNYSSTLFIDTDTDEVGGVESNFSISLKIPLKQVRSITFIRERTT